MKQFSLHTLRSSFWFWFVGTLVVNEIVLFTIFYFVFLKPSTEIMAHVIGAAVESSVSAVKNSPQSGVTTLQSNLSKYQLLKVDVDHGLFSEIPSYFLGMRVVKESLEKNAPNLKVGFPSQGEPELLVKSLDTPGVVFRVAIRGQMYATRMFALSFLLIFVIGAAAALWISSRLVRPLQHLSDSALRLAQERDFRDIALLPGASREIVYLTQTINEMRTALDATMQEREALLAGVAHDLRTPLSRMRLALELEGAGNNELTGGLREDVVEMGAVMEQFIELSRLNLEVEEPWVEGDINALVQEIAAKYRRVGIHLRLALTEGLPPVRQKPLALARLLNNLVDNAYRHGNGEVTVKTYLVAGQVAIAVVNPDPGTGENTGLMLALSQGPSGGAAGLGLSIVRRFAEVHAATLRETIACGERTYTLVFRPGQPGA